MVSVCIATYNGAKYIEEQIHSILTQLEENDEIIVSDDHSTDDTLSIIRNINDPRIKIVLNEGKSGVTSNFENALRLAKGDFIFLSDQDDVWLENKVAVMTEYLRKYAYVVSDCYVTDGALNIITDTRYTKASGITKNKFLAFMKSTPYQGSCAAFRKEVLQKALPFPPKVQSHDRWIGFVADFYYSVGFIPDRLILYRRHEENASTATEGKSTESIFSRIQNRIQYIVGLISVFNK